MNNTASVSNIWYCRYTIQLVCQTSGIVDIQYS